TYTITAGAIDATNRNVSVTATDNAGNTTTTADTTNATVDNGAPGVTDANISISGASGTGGTFIIGDTVTATWDDTAGGDNNSDTIAGVTVDFSQFGGGSAIAASNSAGTWTATYSLVSGAIDAANRNVSVTATDNAGNTTTASDTSNASVDNVAPTVTSGNITVTGGSGPGGEFRIGDTMTVTWNNTAGGDNNSDTISGVTFDFSAFGGGAAVAATNSAGSWSATYTSSSCSISGPSLNVSATATDDAGNSTTTAKAVSFNKLSGTLALSSATYSVSESGGSVTVTVDRTGGSDCTVTVDYATSDGTAKSTAAGTGTPDYTATSGTLTFNAGVTSQTFAVPVTSDAVYEGDETFTVTLTNPGGGATLGGTASATVTIVDDDPAPAFSIGDVSQSEGDSGTTAFTFTVTKSGATAVNATVDAASSDGTATTADADYVALGTTTVTFAPTDLTKTVTVNVNGDTTYESDETFDVNLSNPTDATISDNLGVGTIVNDDTAPSFAIDDVSLSEGNSGTTAFTFTVTKSGTTALPATVDVASSDGTATVADNDYAALATTTLTFAPADTTKTVTVNVTGDQRVELDETFNVNLSNPVDSTISDSLGVGTILNDDAAGVTVTPTSGLVTTEAGGTATFTIVLNTQPSADVTFGLSSSDTTEGTVNPASVTFTAVNWITPQTVTITGVDDTIIDGDIAYTITTAPDTVTADPDYRNLDPADVSVTNTDNDAAGVTFSKSTVNTSESGTTDTYTVVLNAQPAADVTLTVTSGDTTEGLLSDSDETLQPAVTLTFTAADWNVAQTVTVTGQDDSLTDGNQTYAVSTSSASSDSNWNGLTIADVTATNSDDDSPGVTVAPITGLITTEAGGTATFTVVLNAQPAADVSIDLSSSDTTEGLVSTNGVTQQSSVTLTFTPAAWNVPQTITVHGQDDFVTDGDQGYAVTTSASTSTDPLWNGLTVDDVSVTNQDDEVSQVTVTPTSGLVTTEAGGTATFTIVLTSQPMPGTDVSILLSSSDTTEGTVSPSSVVFDPTNWNVPQTVTAAGVDDSVDDGDQPWTVVTSDAISADPTYSGLGVADPGVTNIDDDSRGVTVTPTSGLTTTEAGGTATFTIVLDSQPLADVTIGVGSSDGSEGAVSPANVVFTAANWNVPQTVTAIGVDDLIDDGDQAWTIVTANAVSTDPAYNGLPVADVSAVNLDNDTSGVTVMPSSGLSTTEAGGSGSFTIVLDTQPASNVTITLSSSDTTEGTVSPIAVTFTSSNWNVPQSVTVTGVDDNLADGDQPYTIVTSTTASADPTYAGLAVPDVSVTNVDDETSASDSDGDGVLDVTENAGPNGGDANDDGTSDYLQPQVASLPPARGGGYLTVISSCELRDVRTLTKDSIAPTPLTFPYGLVQFRMPCATADMHILYHAGSAWPDATQYWKHGPTTPGDTSTTKWYQLPAVTFDTTTVAGSTVARANFTLTDGTLGDDTGVDGEIIDQGGPIAPASSATAIPTASGWALLLMAMLLAVIAVVRLR
ncbi:MAG: Calx-beta domain-containing protein, partial [Thermoanaerobaculia bacterium]